MIGFTRRKSLANGLGGVASWSLKGTGAASSGRPGPGRFPTPQPYTVGNNVQKDRSGMEPFLTAGGWQDRHDLIFCRLFLKSPFPDGGNPKPPDLVLTRGAAR